MHLRTGLVCYEKPQNPENMPLHVLATPNISLRRLIDGNFPQIQNITRQKLYSNTQIFAFAKELLREPNDCSRVTVYCCLRSSLSLGLHS